MEVKVKPSIETSVFWFRRDLRLNDNHGLFRALSSSKKVILLFIFDQNIIESLQSDDPRVSFILQSLDAINKKLGSVSILSYSSTPEEAFERLFNEYKIDAVFSNEDYEPYGIDRDERIKTLCFKNNISFYQYKDHVIFRPGEILKPDGIPYKVFTPFSKSWKKKLPQELGIHFPSESLLDKIVSTLVELPNIEQLGFTQSPLLVNNLNTNALHRYKDERDFPSKDSGSYAGPLLRFGIVSIRLLVQEGFKRSESFLNELIWREFFMHILYHFPYVVGNSFKRKYDGIEWRNNVEEFEAWCKGKTGFPLVDAGMRQLSQTGYMHNRVRMITASFLVKHLLIDWRWGEAYFAEKLLDFELSSNNGNWQWVAGCGCDAAPYFRVFNPVTQLQKFDKSLTYVRKWIPELNESSYPKPIVDHKNARERALNAYKEVL